MKCPTCGKLFGTTIYQCGTGHSACGTCKTDNRPCGQCMQPLTDIKNYSLQEYIAGLNLEASKLPCPNIKNGCKKFFTEDKLSAHLKKCHACMDCPMAAHNDKCIWKGSLSQLSGHFAAAHPDTLKATVDQELVLRPNILKDLNIDSFKTINFIDLGAYKFLTFLTLDKSGAMGTVSMSVQMLANEKSASYWYFELHIYNKAEPYRKITFRDRCKSINAALDEEEVTCVIPLPLARTFYNERIEGMNYKFFIKRIAQPTMNLAVAAAASQKKWKKNTNYNSVNRNSNNDDTDDEDIAFSLF